MNPRDRAELDKLSRDTKGGTMMSDWAYAHQFGMAAYREMKRREDAAKLLDPAKTRIFGEDEVPA